MEMADSLELAEDVCVLRQDASGLQHRDAEGKDTAHLQMTSQTFWSSQLSIHIT